MRHQDPFSAHVTAVDCLVAARIPAPAAWKALRDRLFDFQRLEHPCTERLVAEIVNPTGLDVETLRALALAEQTATNTHEVELSNQVRAAVHEKLSSLYEPVAQQNYAVAARRFDQASAQFLAAAETVNPEATSDEIITLTEKQRLAWLAAADYAETLNEAMAILAQAAQLVGAPDADTDEAEVQLPLTVRNLGKLHKRRVYVAWAATGRCGRWSALVALGARLGATRNPERIELFSPPRPMVQSFVMNVNTGRYEQRITDPEDTPNVPVDDGTVEWSVA